MTNQTTSPPRELVAWIRSVLDDVLPGQFLLIEYLTDDDQPVDPYAQAAPDPTGWYCEIVSSHYLPADQWELDERALTRRGWRHPDAVTLNWWRADVDDHEVATVLADALWSGRSCRDPYRYALSVGTFPSGPNGGEERSVDLGLSLAA